MIISRIANIGDISSVLKLQDLYLYSNLNPEQRKEGFVTTPFTVEQLQEAIKEKGLFVTQDNHRAIIAYAFGASWHYFSQWEIFNYMVSRFPLLSFDGKKITTSNSFQYGPVCIDKKYRGTGLLSDLFEEMRIELLKKFPISLTFINKVNLVSEKAHVKLGWIIIDEFEFNHNSYIALAYNMNQSAKQT